MALAVAQAKKIENGSGNSVTVNGALTATTGNLMVAGLVGYGSGISALVASDNNNGTYAADNLTLNGPDAATCIRSAVNITGGSLNLTASATGGAAIVASFHEVSGAATTTPLDSATGGTSGGASSTNPQTSSITNAQADEIFFAVMGNNDGANPATLTVNSTGSTGGTWSLFSSTQSQELDATTIQSLSMPSLIVSAIASTKHGWTTNNFAYSASIAAYKMASGVSFDPATVPWASQPGLPIGSAVVGF